VGWISEYGHKLQFDTQGRARCEESGDKYVLENNKVIKLD
jgi:UDP-2-acetamido-3-amino-2,3-dideoxy-glucuronate N-acetyltransferase